MIPVIMPAVSALTSSIHFASAYCLRFREESGVKMSAIAVYIIPIDCCRR